MYRRLALCTPIFIGELALVSTLAPQPRQWPLSVTVRGGGARLLAWLDAGLLDYLLADLVRAESMMALPKQLRLALMAHALDPVLSALEKHFGTALAVLDTTDKPPAGGGAAVTLDLYSDGAYSGSFRLSCDEGAWQRLHSLLRDQPPVRKQNLPPLSVPLVVGLPGMRLSADEVRYLRRGDVLRPGVHPDTVVLPLRIGSRRVGDAVIDGDDYTIRRLTMSSEEDEDDFESEQPEQSIDAGAVELEVTFDIGRTQLSVDELSALQPGYVFSLPGATADSVVVRANGTPIGRGELVAIGEELGVRLLETSGGDDRSHQ